MNVQPIANPIPSVPGAQPVGNDLGTNLRQAQSRQASSSGIAVDPMRAPGATQKVEKEQLEQAVKEVQDFVATVNQNLEFSVDDDTGRTVIKVIDRQTEQILRQIPSEEMLQIAKALGKLNGILVQQQA